MDPYDLKKCIHYLLDGGTNKIKNPRIIVNIPSSDFDSVISDIFASSLISAKNSLKYDYVDDFKVYLIYHGKWGNDIYYILAVNSQKNTYTRIIINTEVYFIIERIGKGYYWLDDYGQNVMKNAERREITLFSLLSSI